MTMPPVLDPYLTLTERFPHCDQYVLHATDCEYCAMEEFAPLRAYREANDINFTGENDPAKKPCPAEERRPLERIERWGGNRAKP